MATVREVDPAVAAEAALGVGNVAMRAKIRNTRGRRACCHAYVRRLIY